MSQCGHERVSHVVGICAGVKKEMRSRVDVFIALTGRGCDCGVGWRNARHGGGGVGLGERVIMGTAALS